MLGTGHMQQAELGEEQLGAAVASRASLWETHDETLPLNPHTELLCRHLDFRLLAS